MFQPIKADNLHYNRKYKIVGTHEYSGIYIGKIWIRNQAYLQFKNCHALQSTTKSTKYFLHSRKYYVLVSQKAKIQSDMERRAVNLIVRRLIGDNCFEW